MKESYMKKVAGGTVKSIPMKEMKLLGFVLPTMVKQNQIVNVIEQFDRLCNSLSEGLPVELSLRQKQYEYFRDKLLTFRRKQL